VLVRFGQLLDSSSTLVPWPTSAVGDKKACLKGLSQPALDETPTRLRGQ
jgi:hypothetical protein